MKIGYCLTGSFCTFKKSIEAMQSLADGGHIVTPIMSFNAYNIDTRFGNAKDVREKVASICGRDIISTIDSAEPIGPKHMFDVLCVVPCTSNTLAKLANGINDTPVTMAVKSHLRNDKPVVIGVSTNDALGASAQNIGRLLNTKNIYFVPLKQDDCIKKPNSIVADFDKLEDCVTLALQGKQHQPIFL